MLLIVYLVFIVCLAQVYGSFAHACYPISVMSSVSITLAHVLDGIAMSIKTSTSLKKALSYRAVEILLVDLHGYQKVNQESLFDSGTVRTDRHQVPEVIHEVLPKNGSSIIGKEHKYILSGTARADRQQVAKVVREVLPKRKSPFIDVQGSDIGLEAARAGQEVAEVISEIPPKHKRPFIDAHNLDIGFTTACAGFHQNAEVAHKVLKSPFIDAQGATACAGPHQVIEVVHKVVKSQFIDAQDATACTGPQQVAEVVHKVPKSPFIDAQGATARAGRQQVLEVVHQILKSPFIDAQGSKERSTYERFFSERLRFVKVLPDFPRHEFGSLVFISKINIWTIL